ncbi:MAG: hypothetical protein FJ125_16115, partial [Deltaproteobacteria bacterium]|nr:hypothetical protein [Deltaproteobacteria bacterium]
MRQQERTVMPARGFDFFRPRSLEEVWRLQREIPGSLLLAGGTDLLVRLENRQLRPPALISLRNVPGLAGVQQDGATRLGALTTVTDL